jgi:multiple antibiotic resistance protein
VETFVDFFIAFSVQLFIIVDPVAGVPVFLAITPQNSRVERRQMAVRGCTAAFAVAVFFILVGPWLVDYFGVRTAAIRICGGILLFIIAIEMLYGRPTGTGTSRREERLAEVKEDISITPLAVPLLAGPGAIATCLLFSARAQGPFSYLALLAGAAAVFGATFLLLSRADELVGWLGALGTAILTRIMGLILAFIAVEYVVDGVVAVLKL